VDLRDESSNGVLGQSPSGGLGVLPTEARHTVCTCGPHRKTRKNTKQTQTLGEYFCVILKSA